MGEKTTIRRQHRIQRPHPGPATNQTPVPVFPPGVIWVFAIKPGAELDPDPKPGTIVYKVGIRSAGGGWSVETDAEPPVPKTAPYPNGYTDDHFTHVYIGRDANGDLLANWDGQPTPIDLMCRVEGGLIVPDFRQLLQNPAQLADLCEPCSEGTA